MSSGFIPDRDVNGNVIQTVTPFASKSTKDGKKIFKRIHGIKQVINIGQTISIDFVVPYDMCKITGVEIIGAQIGDTANFKVYDTPTGSISTVPNYMLNQFGFNVNLRKDFHKEESSYDADLIKDMKISMEFTNSSLLQVTIGINFILHELK